MIERLKWVHTLAFMDKVTWALFVIEKDIDYYTDLSGRYTDLYKNSERAGADTESLDIIYMYSKKG